MSSSASAALRIDRGLHAAGVVRVEVDRNADLLLQRLDQQLGGIGLAQAGHVLDGQDVAPIFSSSLARST